MNFRSKFVAVAGSALILASSITTGSAAESTASVSITRTDAANVLSVSITNASFVAVPYSFTGQDTTGDLTVTVTDTRGTAAGWNVTLSGSDFTTAGEAPESFAVGNLALEAGEVSSVEDVDREIPANLSTTDIAPESASPVLKTGTEGGMTKILSAAIGSGAGKFELPMTGLLNIPGGTLVGDYTSNVTVSIVSGP